MGLFSKKEKVPEIAPAPTLPELPKKEEDDPKKNLPELPSFPNNSSNDNLNQEMVKSAVTDNLTPGENEVNGAAPASPPVTEAATGGTQQLPPKPSVQSVIPEPPRPMPTPITHPSPQVTTTPESPTPMPMTSTPPSGQGTIPSHEPKKEEKPKPKQSEPIYVRIDKFQSAQKNFETVKEKINEIETLLQKVKDIKAQEENELNGWTEDIEKIKARLADVDSEIFDQL